MRRDFAWVSLPLLLVLVLPALGADTKTDTDKKPATDAPPPKEHWTPAGEAVGTIKHVDTAQKHLKLEIENTIVEPKVSGRRITYAPKTMKKELDLQTSDTVTVRLANPPVEYDDKGNIKTYTSKELKELKGSDKSWGYPAEFDAVKNGQVVKVILGTVKVAPADPKDKDSVKEAQAASQPKVRAIYILKDVKDAK